MESLIRKRYPNSSNDDSTSKSSISDVSGVGEMSNGDDGDTNVGVVRGSGTLVPTATTTTDNSSSVRFNWISVADRLPGENDGYTQLVVYLKPSIGLCVAEIGIGRFDNPDNNYEDSWDKPNGRGWVDPVTEDRLKVTHWQRLPELPARFQRAEKSNEDSISAAHLPSNSAMLSIGKRNDNWIGKHCRTRRN